MNKKLIFSFLILASGSLLASDSQQSTPRGPYTPRPAPLGTPRPVSQHLTPSKAPLCVHDTPSKQSVVSSDTACTASVRDFRLFLRVQEGSMMQNLPYENPQATIEQVLCDNEINLSKYLVLTPKTRKPVQLFRKAQSVQDAYVVLLKKPFNPFEVSDTEGDATPYDSQSDQDYLP